MGSVLAKLKPLLRAYLAFATAHTLYKLAVLLRKLFIKRFIWSHINGYPFDPLMRKERYVGGNNVNLSRDSRLILLE